MNDIKVNIINWFETRAKCETMLIEYMEIPADGSWDTVEYICKPVGSLNT